MVEELSQEESEKLVEQLNKQKEFLLSQHKKLRSGIEGLKIALSTQ